MSIILVPASTIKKQSLFRFENLAMVALTLLLFVSSIKDDIDLFEDSAFWSEISNSSLLLFTKSHVYILYGFMFLVMIASFMHMRRIAVHLSAPALTFSLIYLFGFLRSFTVDPSFSTKMIMGFAFLLLLQVYIGLLFLNRSENAVRIIEKAFLSMSSILIMFNWYEYLTGNGFVGASGQRFFGTASHPNFLGVQIGISCLAQLYFLRSPNLFKKALYLFFTCVGLLILYRTGSRTGLVVFVTGTFCYLLIAARYSTIAALAVTFGPLIAILLYLWTALDVSKLDVYNREGGANTRADAWNVLWTSIRTHPFLGEGGFVGPSEGSMLRGWSALGIAYPFMFLLTCGLFVRRNAVMWAGNRLLQVAILLAIIVGATMGSIFEGYLVDTFSFPLIAWFMALTTISAAGYQENLAYRKRIVSEQLSGLESHESA